MNKKYTKEMLTLIVKDCLSISQVIDKLNLKHTGGNHSNIKNRIKEFAIDISHMTGQSWRKDLIFKTNIDHLLVENAIYSTGLPIPSSRIKHKLFVNNIKEKICEKCRSTEWQNLPIPLELHHLNGIKTDNRIENLQILCPNCHAQTDNYCGKNKN